MKQTTIYDSLPPNFVQQIYDFNQQAGLLDKGYDDFLESSFQIEEALEGYKSYGLTNLQTHLAPSVKDVKPTPKGLSRLITAIALSECHENCCKTTISDVDRLDKSIDAIVYAIGAIAKLGLNVEQIHRAISAVTEANLQKLSCPKDEFGKLTKPTDFVGPEVKLQAILDERNT